MKKKMDIVLGGIELLVALGVSTLVGSALVLVKPTNLGAIKKVAVGVGGMAISCMAVDEVTNYVDKQFHQTVQQFKNAFAKKPEEETIKEEEAI